MTDPAPDKTTPPEIERIPFSTLGWWAGNHLWANWVFFVSLLWIAAGGLYLLFVFAGPNADIRFPELMYGLGVLLVVLGLQMILLDLLAEHHRANIRLYAEIGKEAEPNRDPNQLLGVMGALANVDEAKLRHLANAADVLATKPRDITLNYNAVVEAIRTLPLARFLIVAGIVTMFLGAGVDDLWDIPDITFTTGGAGDSTPSATPGS